MQSMDVTKCVVKELYAKVPLRLLLAEYDCSVLWGHCRKNSWKNWQGSGGDQPYFVAESYLAYKHVDEGHAGAVLLAAPFLAALSLLRDMKSLVPFSLLANIATVAGLGVVVVEAGARIASHGIHPNLPVFHW